MREMNRHERGGARKQSGGLEHELYGDRSEDRNA
jgi:hypothetical protein